MAFWKSRSALTVVTFVVALLAGCGSPAEAVDSTTDAAPVAAAASAGKEITLAEGWKMKEAISAAEVGAITGTKMEYFPEASASPKNGRPAAGYTIPGTAYSKISFIARLNDGKKEFEIQKQHAIEGSFQELSGLGDKAYIMDLENESTVVMVLLGEASIRISWYPRIYEGFDKVELGRELAGKLIDNMTR